MLTREENDLLVMTGPGTPMGALMRRIWQPTALCEELRPGGAPLSVRILGEDLVLRQQYAAEVGPDFRSFRNRQNRYLQDREQLKTDWFSERLGGFEEIGLRPRESGQRVKLTLDLK